MTHSRYKTSKLVLQQRVFDSLGGLIPQTPWVAALRRQKTSQHIVLVPAYAPKRLARRNLPICLRRFAQRRFFCAQGEGLFFCRGPSPMKWPYRGLRGRTAGEGVGPKMRPSPKIMRTFPMTPPPCITSLCGCGSAREAFREMVFLVAAVANRKGQGHQPKMSVIPKNQNRRVRPRPQAVGPDTRIYQ